MCLVVCLVFIFGLCVVVWPGRGGGGGGGVWRACGSGFFFFFLYTYPGVKVPSENACAAKTCCITRIFGDFRKFHAIREKTGEAARCGGITSDFAHAPLAPIHYAVA